MKGKVLKIFNNDLYGNTDDREVAVFACFNHKKYMNNYVIFTFLGEYNKNKLYYGSLHIKENSIVIFATKGNASLYVNTFKEQYLNNLVDINEYEILDISKIEKVEIISYSEMECDKLNILDEISIPKKIVKEEVIVKEKKPIFLYVSLVILILLSIGLTYFYLNPDTFSIEYKKLTCEKKLINNELNMNYIETREVNFDKEDKVKEINVTNSYIFNNEDEYLEFRDNNYQDEYFNQEGTYKYDNDNLRLNIFYQDVTIIDNYEDMYKYLKKEGYSCTEGKYYE